MVLDCNGKVVVIITLLSQGTTNPKENPWNCKTLLQVSKYVSLSTRVGSTLKCMKKWTSDIDAQTRNVEKKKIVQRA